MLYNLHFFSSKCRLFHNDTLFGFCITHILNTGCAKIWKKKSVAKRLSQCSPELIQYCADSPYKKQRSSETTRSPDILVGALAWSRTKRPFLSYMSQVCPVYHSYSRTGPIPNHLSLHAIGETAYAVTCLQHCVQFSVSDNRILCKHTLMDSMSWITVYHVERTPSGNIALRRFPHTREQSIAGWSSVMPVSLVFIAAV